MKFLLPIALKVMAASIIAIPALDDIVEFVFAVQFTEIPAWDVKVIFVFPEVTATVPVPLAIEVLPTALSSRIIAESARFSTMVPTLRAVFAFGRVSPLITKAAASRAARFTFAIS